MGTGRPGRPATKLDFERFKKLKLLVNAGELSVLDVCKILNISTYIYYKWIDSVDDMIAKDMRKNIQEGESNEEK